MWKIRGNVQFGLMGYIFTDKGIILPEYIKEIDTRNEKCYLDDGPWNTYEVDKGIFFSIYRKRFIIYESSKVQNKDCVDRIVRYSLDRTNHYTELINKTLPEGIRYRTYRFAFIDRIRFKDGKSFSNIINEGITTFNIRINDSTGNTGLVRISTHILLCAGIKGHVLQEVINMCYEKMLTFDEEVSAQKVFSFLDGLSRFTIPSEENRFLQKAVVKVTLVLTLVPILFNLIIDSELAIYTKIPLFSFLILLIIFLAFKPLLK